jgi:membrane protein implicated in regulation of membrane protease activity
MMLRVFAALLLISGLALGVLVTFFGVERRKGRVIRRPHPALNLPAIAAAMTAWGAVAYGTSRAGAAPLWSIVSAFVAAALAWVSMGALLAKWALRAPLEDPHEMAEMLQGHVAVVTSPIAKNPGSIAYQLQGQSFVSPARSVDGRAIEAGTDVVIERIDGDMAYVEPWSLVEQRL